MSVEGGFTDRIVNDLNGSNCRHATILSRFGIRTMSSCGVGGGHCEFRAFHEADPACADEDRRVVAAQRHAVPVQCHCRSLAPVADTAIGVACAFDS